MPGSRSQELCWVDGALATEMTQPSVQVLALGTLGVMTTQIIPMRARGALMVQAYEDLALQVLRLVSVEQAPRAGLIGEWIEEGIHAFAGSSALRLSVGYSFGAGLSEPKPVLLAAVAPLPEPEPLRIGIDLALASHPIVVFPPLAGLPLAMTSERRSLLRSAMDRGAGEVLLRDLGDSVVDLAESTLVTVSPGGLCTPSAERGAIRTPLRDRLVNDGVLSEKPGGGAPYNLTAQMVLTRWGRVIPVRTVDGSVLPESTAAVAMLADAVDGVLGK